MTGRMKCWRRIAVVAMLAVATATAAVIATASSPLPEQAATADDAIERAVQTVHAVSGGRRLMLLGELHGTREVPRLVAALAQHYAADGPVLVAVEIAYTEQDAIDVFLHSDGGTAARDALRGRPYWHRTDTAHDGRRNEDLIDLFDALCRLRRAGRDVAVLAFDVPAAAGSHARTPAGRARAHAGACGRVAA